MDTDFHGFLFPILLLTFDIRRSDLRLLCFAEADFRPSSQQQKSKNHSILFCKMCRPDPYVFAFCKMCRSEPNVFQNVGMLDLIPMFPMFSFLRFLTQFGRSYLSNMKLSRCPCHMDFASTLEGYEFDQRPDPSPNQAEKSLL